MPVLDSVINVLSLSLAFALIGLNVYLSTKILNVTDLTCDASVALGGCSYGALLICGINPLVGFLLATFLGATAGFITSSLVSYAKIEPVLASIVTLTGLQTFITKFSAVGDAASAKGFIFSSAPGHSLIIVLIVAFAVCALLFKFLNSEYGLGMRVYGDGKIISESLGIDTNKILLMGLGIGNALSAVAGALMMQISGHFSSGMGGGSLVFGLASVIIGETILEPKNVKTAILGCFVGALVYKIMIEIITFSGSEYNHVIMASVLILLMVLIQDRNRKRHSL
jgi:putative ABC transport system permease protein